MRRLVTSTSAVATSASVTRTRVAAVSLKTLDEIISPVAAGFDHRGDVKCANGIVLRIGNVGFLVLFSERRELASRPFPLEHAADPEDQEASGEEAQQHRNPAEKIVEPIHVRLTRPCGVPQDYDTGMHATAHRGNPLFLPRPC
jgi:hypothetical protein